MAAIDVFCEVCDLPTLRLGGIFTRVAPPTCGSLLAAKADGPIETEFCELYRFFCWLDLRVRLWFT